MTYRLGNAVIPKSRLKEFVGTRAAKAITDPVTAPKVEPPASRPSVTKDPTLAEVLNALKTVERKVEAIRKVVIDVQGNRVAVTRNLRLVLSAQEQQQMMTMENAFVKVYGDPLITPAVLKSSTRRRRVSTARGHLFKLITGELPGLRYSTMGVYFMRDPTSIYAAIKRTEGLMKGKPGRRQFHADLDRRWRSELERSAGEG